MPADARLCQVAPVGFRHVKVRTIALRKRPFPGAAAKTNQQQPGRCGESAVITCSPTS
ncbi:MAG: hypothetical protein M5U34_07640 [Chloroflexi bacterium]|nr:hypothetical protein [Chloroflexota bacterium]